MMGLHPSGRAQGGDEIAAACTLLRMPMLSPSMTGPAPGAPSNAKRAPPGPPACGAPPQCADPAPRRGEALQVADEGRPRVANS